MTFNIDQLKKKIIYRSNYRGTKEMDKLLGAFTKKYINQLNQDELIDLEKMLDIDDTSLYNFFNGIDNEIKIVAEGLRFELRKELPLCRFSRPVLSTAQPSLREKGFIIIII